MYSMTGFGKSISDINEKKLSVEVRTLNSKNIDIALKIPSVYKEKELELRSHIKNKLHRGKIDFLVRMDGVGGESFSLINSDLFKKYYNQFVDLGKEIGYDISASDLPSIIVKMPDVLHVCENEYDDDEWKLVLKTCTQAIDMCIEFRKQEGDVILKDAEKRICKIKQFLEDISKFEHTRIEKIKQRITQNKQEFLNEIIVDANRFEQELVYYIEKLDITEEKVRLKNHCVYFLEELKHEGAIGKKLGFILQEIGREINTIGSKANDCNIQRLVVKMKDELEKIKEQMMNVL